MPHALNAVFVIGSVLVLASCGCDKEGDNEPTAAELEAMQREIAREIARSEGFQTKFILPLSLYHQEGQKVFVTAEALLEHIDSNTPLDEVLLLRIDNDFAFGGSKDSSGTGMAVVLDRLLALGYFPDGFEQENGYKIYRYER